MGNTTFAGVGLAFMFVLIIPSGIAVAAAPSGPRPVEVAVGVLFCLFAIAGIRYAIRMGTYGVLADERGVTSLQPRWFLRLIHTPWEEIDHFEAHQYEGYGACAVLRDGRQVRLGGISASMFGKRSRRRVDAIVEALNTELGAAQSHWRAEAG
jgi:hypothetical protein